MKMRLPAARISASDRESPVHGSAPAWGSRARATTQSRTSVVQYAARMPLPCEATSTIGTTAFDSAISISGCALTQASKASSSVGVRSPVVAATGCAGVDVDVVEAFGGHEAGDDPRDEADRQDGQGPEPEPGEALRRQGPDRTEHQLAGHDGEERDHDVDEGGEAVERAARGRIVVDGHGRGDESPDRERGRPALGDELGVVAQRDGVGERRQGGRQQDHHEVHLVLASEEGEAGNQDREGEGCTCSGPGMRGCSCLDPGTQPAQPVAQSQDRLGRTQPLRPRDEGAGGQRQSGEGEGRPDPDRMGPEQEVLVGDQGQGGSQDDQRCGHERLPRLDSRVPVAISARLLCPGRRNEPSAAACP